MTLQKNAFPLKRCVGKMSREGLEIATVRKETSSLSLESSSYGLVWLKNYGRGRKFRDRQSRGNCAREICVPYLCDVCDVTVRDLSVAIFFNKSWLAFRERNFLSTLYIKVFSFVRNSEN